VRDYVELHFDGPVLRCLADPVVDTAGDPVAFPQPGSRDALCELIGREVRLAADEPDHLRLDFAPAGTVTVPKRSPTAGPEIAHLARLIGRRSDDQMMIWENLT
jgi:hypothetical protein